jgi:murein L,D-transpeptidase YafK
MNPPFKINHLPISLAVLALFVLSVLSVPVARGEEVIPDGVKVRNWTDWEYDGPSRSSARVAAARQAKEETVKALFEGAGVEFPPHQLLLRVFKDEDLMEVWAGPREGKLRLITRYQICAASGSAGPKRKQGDWQVPEGFYTIDAFNDHSSYYLSMRISYPNRSDRILGHPKRPGSAIMIHGNCVSIGCLAMSDERMQEIWLMADGLRQQKRKIHVHIFPGRDLNTYIAAMPNVDLKAFWKNLQEGYESFETNRRIPRVKVDKKGRYLFSTASSRP